MNLQKTPDGVIVEVYVKPNSKQFAIQLDHDTITVQCKQAPVKGKVNKELLKQFTKLFGKRVELVSGSTSRQKKLLVYDIELNEAERVMASVLG
ncbi:MAG: DUF167 family protein [Candidatus Bathyarchaeota archaeon]|nr:DUF167 family protein [Candidatus Bathyarchaeota archaeon]